LKDPNALPYDIRKQILEQDDIYKINYEKDFLFQEEKDTKY